VEVMAVPVGDVVVVVVVEGEAAEGEAAEVVAEVDQDTNFVYVFENLLFHPKVLAPFAIWPHPESARFWYMFSVGCFELCRYTTSGVPRHFASDMSLMHVSYGF